MGFIMHFYIIFGTNLLTEGPVQIAVFLPISVFHRKAISNGMKPSRGSFLEQTQSKRLGVDVKEATRKPQGREVRPGGLVLRLEHCVGFPLEEERVMQ